MRNSVALVRARCAFGAFVNRSHESQVSYVQTCCLASYFVGYRQSSASPDQTPQKAVSDQGLHCLLTESVIKISSKNEKRKIPSKIPKLKWVIISIYFLQGWSS